MMMVSVGCYLVQPLRSPARIKQGCQKDRDGTEAVGHSRLALMIMNYHIGKNRPAAGCCQFGYVSLPALEYSLTKRTIRQIIKNTAMPIR